MTNNRKNLSISYISQICIRYKFYIKYKRVPQFLMHMISLISQRKLFHMFKLYRKCRYCIKNSNFLSNFSSMYHLLSQTLARAATAAGKQTVSCSAFTVHRSIAVAKQDNTTVPLSESLVILNFSFPHWPKASTVNCFLSCPSPCT